MLVATRDSVRVRPEPGVRAACPECLTAVIPKCGEVRTWHFAHEATGECRSEPESDWHLEWKARFPFDWREIRLGNHRADVRSPRGFVIEIQHSAISVPDLLERDRFWKGAVWIFDVAEPFARGLIQVGAGTMSWKKSWAHVTRPMLTPYFDIGGGLVIRPHRWYWRLQETGSDYFPLVGAVDVFTPDELAAELTKLYS